MINKYSEKILDILNSTIKQKQVLNTDIINFYVTKNNGLNLYKTKYENVPYINFFTNDIASYLNEQCAIIDGCVPKFYNTFKRLYQNKNKDKKELILFYLINLKKQRETELNILWGLLKPYERNEFLINFI
jgi:hypothetical protein